MVGVRTGSGPLSSRFSFGIGGDSKHSSTILVPGETMHALSDSGSSFGLVLSLGIWIRSPLIAPAWIEACGRGGLGI